MIDWSSLSKTLVLEAAFAGTMVAILTGHATPDIDSLAWALGGTLGLLRVTDVVASTVKSGQAATVDVARTGTTTGTNGGNGHASTPAP